MLKVTVDILPGGDKSLRRTIEKIDIININHEKHPELGNYIARCKDEIRFIRDYPRKHAVLPLLQSVLKALNKKTNIGFEVSDLDKNKELKTYSFDNLEDVKDYYFLQAVKQYKKWKKSGRKIYAKKKK